MAATMKKQRFTPCAIICSVFSNSVIYITKSPPPPTPIPERVAIIREIINIFIFYRLPHRENENVCDELVPKLPF